jgi:hypothetical protein
MALCGTIPDGLATGKMMIPGIQKNIYSKAYYGSTIVRLDYPGEIIHLGVLKALPLFP